MQMQRMEINGVATWSFMHQAIIILKILKTDSSFTVEIWNLWMVGAVRSVISCKVLVLMMTPGYQLRLFVKDSVQSFSEGHKLQCDGFPL